MEMTSAYANKLLRQLNEEKEFLLNQEENSCTYVYAADEEPLIPAVQLSADGSAASGAGCENRENQARGELQQCLHQPDAKQRTRADS